MQSARSRAAISQKRLDRMRAILGILGGQEDATVEALASSLQVSSVSVRRDLAQMETEGYVIRTHGRVRTAGQHAEIPVRMRDSQLASAKRRIALFATQLLDPGPQAIAVSGGSTTNEVVRALRHRHDTTVLTNALSIAVEAATASRLKVMVTGGTLRAASLEAVGPLAERAFETFNIQTAFLGADGVSSHAGVTTHDETEARTNNSMVSHARRVIVVSDGSKVGRVTMARMADLSAVDDLVTDSTADPAELASIRRAGVTVHVVPDRGP